MRGFRSRRRASVSAAGFGLGGGLGFSGSAGASASASAGGSASLGGYPALLVDEGLQAVGEVAGQRRQQAGELRERRLQGARELSEQHLAARQVGEGRDLVRREHALAEQAALHDERRVDAGVVAERLGHRGGVAFDERDRGRTDEQLVERVDAGAVRTETGQRVLVDLVVAARGPQRAAQLGDRRDVEAAVLGEQRRIGPVQPFLHLGDDGDLLGSGIFHAHLLQKADGRSRTRANAPRRLGGVRLVRRARWPIQRRAPDVCGEQISCGWSV